MGDRSYFLNSLKSRVRPLARINKVIAKKTNPGFPAYFQTGSVEALNTALNSLSHMYYYIKYIKHYPMASMLHRTWALRSR
ncbi:uncharacterized protein LAJ45_07750 [Morchella importuna]|uniref:uncharacterized protein n=1 Tax=Morchella importuna TaxID=1174673 RepID=UPI001E8E256F|nr:uncharacterized protein LAJ45_07750 [Morchella importuna]KAH8148297.1 hypothetical protein LAJ45_07750 [Morchella importuna]